MIPLSFLDQVLELAATYGSLTGHRYVFCCYCRGRGRYVAYLQSRGEYGHPLSADGCTSADATERLRDEIESAIGRMTASGAA